MIRKAFPLLTLLSLVCTAGFAHAQADLPPTPFEKQLQKIDLSINIVGEYNRSVTGNIIPPNAPDYFDGTGTLTQFGSNTAGAIIALQYVAKPYFGLEANYGYARYTENYEGTAISGAFGTPNFQVQTKVNEYTFGYLASPPHPVFGFQPFLSGGVGILNFTPTPNGGQEEYERARFMYYYSLGLQKDYGAHLGFRAGFRELFFLAPDFNQNYLMIGKHTTTYEPMAGFYFRF